MQTVNYRGFTVTLSDVDTEKLGKAWSGATKHWRCIVYDKANRKQMGFDVFGGSHATMSPLEALRLHCAVACEFMDFSGDIKDIMNALGYDYKTAKKLLKEYEKAYYKCRRFIGSDDDIRELEDDLRWEEGEEWG